MKKNRAVTPWYFPSQKAPTSSVRPQGGAKQVSSSIEKYLTTFMEKVKCEVSTAGLKARTTLQQTQSDFWKKNLHPLSHMDVSAVTL